MSLKLSIRSIASGVFEVEVDEDSTVEFLRVAIFSLKPELGEEMKMIHKGKILSDDDALLTDIGVVNGDCIAVARQGGKPVKPITDPAPSPIAADCPTSQIEADTTDAKLVADIAKDSAPVPQADNVVVDIVATAIPVSIAPDPADQTCEPDTGNNDSTDANADGDFTTVCATQTVDVDPGTHVAELPPSVDVEVAPEPAAKRPCIEQAEAGSTPVPDAAGTAASASSADVQPDAAPPAPSSPSAESQVEVEVEVSPESLLAMASRLETGEVPPAEVAQLLRRTAGKLELMQGVVGEFGQALQMVNLLSGRVLQGVGAAAQMPAGSSAPKQEEEGRSFMIKRGDADVQELHQRSLSGNSQRGSPTSASGSTSWGSSTALSASSTPKTREEMDKARAARLEKLEAQQAEKKKQMADAQDKAKSRDSLFNKPFTGPAKPLGKH